MSSASGVSREPVRRPSRNAPLRLMASVPNGNGRPTRAPMAPSSRKRAIAPQPPTAATAHQSPTVTPALRSRRTQRRRHPDRDVSADDARRRIADREAHAAVAQQGEDLQLHRRERRERAAEPGAEERTAVGRLRQALLQPRHRVGEHDRARTLIRKIAHGHCVVGADQMPGDPDAGEGAEHAAGEDRRQLARVLRRHGLIRSFRGGTRKEPSALVRGGRFERDRRSDVNPLRQDSI